MTTAKDTVTGPVEAEESETTIETDGAEASAEPVKKNSSPKKRAAAKKASAPRGSERWQEVIGSFAKAIGKDFEAVSATLAKWLDGSGDEEVGLFGDPDVTPDESLCKILGLSEEKPKVRKAIKGLREAVNPASESAASSAAGISSGPIASGSGHSFMAATNFEAVLPTVPDGGSWLEALKTGGVLRIEQSTVISAVRAALANKVGLYGIPKVLVELMEAFADENDEQVPQDYFRLRKQLLRRSYAEVFEAIDGLDGSYVTESRKRVFFAKVEEYFWPSLEAFYRRLKEWQEGWMAGASNPGVMMAAMFSGGAMGGAIPPGMMQPPDTGTLRDAADAVADAVNRAFAGTGVQIAAALAYDAHGVQQVLQNPRLPAMIGATNRDQMIKKLGVSVPATYPRQETNLTRFVLSVLQVKDQPDGQEGSQFFGALFMLGSQIDWHILGDGGSDPLTESASGYGGSSFGRGGDGDPRDRDIMPRGGKL